jgi:hypothetical protein
MCRKIFAIFTTLIFLLIIASCKSVTVKEVKETEEIIEKPIEEKITYQIEENMWPEKWVTDYGLDAKTLDPENLGSAKKIITIAISKYPEGFLTKNLERVYVLDSLSFQGKEVGGVNLKEGFIYICIYSNVGEDEIKDLFREQYFHHEVGGVLFKKNTTLFDSDAWMNINPKNFEYLPRDSLAWKETIEGFYEPELLESGFIRGQGKTLLEDDFCTFVENLFTNYKRFWDAVESGKYPRIEAKYKETIKFLHLIDNRFDEVYFLKLRQSQEIVE